MLAVACNKDNGSSQPGIRLFDVEIQLALDGSAFQKQGVSVEVASGAEISFAAKTNEDGIASFLLPEGVYTASSFFKETVEGVTNLYNGSSTIAVKDEELAFELPLVKSHPSKLIIKEVYNGGCMDNAGSQNFQYDKYIIVYNNSASEVDASKMCLAMAQISSNLSFNKYPAEGGGCTYYADGWVPASYSIWWFQDDVEVKIPAYSQIVISIAGAIDHTQTYTNSVDLSHADFCLYDIESGFNKNLWYPAPSANIPTTHHMKTKVFGMGTAWAFPNVMAAPFLILPETNIKNFVNQESNFDCRSSNLSANYCKIPQSWVLDAVDIWPNADESANFHRFSPNIDSGCQVFAVQKNGSTTYRNVDKEATEAIPENAGKLVYGYAGNLNPDDGDPSGIDAEASIAQGAKIVYLDTNNSTNDFHIRKVASIKK